MNIWMNILLFYFGSMSFCFFMIRKELKQAKQMKGKDLNERIGLMIVPFLNLVLGIGLVIELYILPRVDKWKEKAQEKRRKTKRKTFKEILFGIKEQENGWFKIEEKGKK